MPAEDHFINRGILKVKINDYLRRELRRAGYAGLDLQKTPLGMRVVVYAARPGMVIGRRGTTVRELTETLEHEFGLEAPQIEVSEIEVPELNGDVMAERLAQRLERGDHFRRAAYGVLRRIIGAGAIGAEISIKGKLTSRRARYQKFRSGFVAKTGEPIRSNVSHGIAYAILKPGILGVQVRIMLPDAVSPDRPTVIHRELEPEAVPATGDEIEIVEEEIPIEEVTELDAILEEGEQIPTEATGETPPVTEPEVLEEPKPPVEVPVEPEPRKPEEKPEPKTKEEKVKEEAKPESKKKEEKPKAKPEPKKKAKVEEKPKTKLTSKKTVAKEEAKPKVKPKVKEKPKVEEKPQAKEKAAAKPKAKAKAKAKEKASPKPKAKPSKKAETKPKKGTEAKSKPTTTSKSSKEKK